MYCILGLDGIVQSPINVSTPFWVELPITQGEKTHETPLVGEEQGVHTVSVDDASLHILDTYEPNGHELVHVIPKDFPLLIEKRFELKEGDT